MVGVANSTVEMHIREFLWRQRNGYSGQRVFINLIQQVSDRFPVNQ